MTHEFSTLLAKKRMKVNTLISQRNGIADEMKSLSEKRKPTPDDICRVDELRTQHGAIDAELLEANREYDELVREAAADERDARAAQESYPTGAGGSSGSSTEQRGSGSTGAAPARSTLTPARWVRTSDDRAATVARDQRFVDHDVVKDSMRARAAADAAIIGPDSCHFGSG